MPDPQGSIGTSGFHRFIPQSRNHRAHRLPSRTPATSTPANLTPVASVAAQLGLVAIGGAAGAILRFGLSSASISLVGDRYPWGTLLVNALGCLAIGLIIGWSEGRRDLPESVRLLLVVGLLGSLTTFSTFAGDTLNLVREGRLPAAALNAVANLALGFALAAFGWWVTRPAAP